MSYSISCEVPSIGTNLSPLSEGGAFLGSTAKLPSTPDFAGVASAKARLVRPKGEVGSRLERFALQSVARLIQPQSRTGACLRNRISGATHVAVKYSKVRSRATYGNLQTCGSVWACPVCAARISEHRRTELVALVNAHKKAGGSVLLVTRTVPHSLSQSLSGLLAKLAIAEDRYKSSGAWKRLQARFGFIGTVRAIECTYGSNGWHPHIHELVFLAGPVDHAALKVALHERWSAVAVRAGFSAPSFQHGLDVRDGSYAAQYASKWGIESELAKWHVKVGKESSLSPFDLLRVALQDDDAAAVKSAQLLFLEYAKAFHGRRQLVYSKGLRDLYLHAPELSDQEVAAGQDIDAEVLGLLTPDHWKALLRAGSRGRLLEAINASEGDWDVIYPILRAALAHQGPAVSPRKELCNESSLSTS